jgi:hypothetical protein
MMLTVSCIFLLSGVLFWHETNEIKGSSKRKTDLDRNMLQKYKLYDEQKTSLFKCLLFKADKGNYLTGTFNLSPVP